jgi:Cu/Ag efflux protein CusF
MRFRNIACLLPAVLLSACGSHKTASKEPLQRYSLHGEIVRLDGQGNIATIRHQKIEGYMEAMTMQFPVKVARDFAGLHPADCIDATVFVQGDNIWIGEIAHRQAEPGTCVAPNPRPPDQKGDSKKNP